MSDFAVIAPENDDLAVKFYDNTASQSTYNISFLLNYASERNWYTALLTIGHALLRLLNVNSCVVNSRITRIVTPVLTLTYFPCFC
jgi:hypothetical protein